VKTVHIQCKFVDIKEALHDYIQDTVTPSTVSEVKQWLEALQVLDDSIKLSNKTEEELKNLVEGLEGLIQRTSDSIKDENNIEREWNFTERLDPLLLLGLTEEHWPLIKSISIEANFGVLPPSMMLVDAPGVESSNSVRIRILRESLQDADAIWLVDSFTRGVCLEEAVKCIHKELKKFSENLNAVVVTHAGNVRGNDLKKTNYVKYVRTAPDNY
jgi:hypothetical protein